MKKACHTYWIRGHVCTFSQRKFLDSAGNQTAVVTIISLLTVNPLKPKINQLIKNSLLTSQKILNIRDKVQPINALGNSRCFLF
jgi:hypothetical protein